MSGTEQELKAGHPPAVKAGGMRITQHKNPKSSSNEPKLSEDSELNSALKVSTSPDKTMTISGAPVRGNQDFPTEAVQSFHCKPVPSHEAPHHNPRQNPIHQPRKQ
uniref:Putative death-associated protein 1 dap-1 n=1 Tax=Triatoma dimidiata TaxID=72491 RepID=A0A0V0G383_TRIDM